METSSHKPDLERLSLLTATILLVYAMTQFIREPATGLSIQLPGFFLPISINFRNLVWLGIAILAGAGMNWMLEGFSYIAENERMQHWLLPALTAWVIGVPLYSLPTGTLWWLVYLLGGLLIALVILAEFYSADPSGDRVSLAALGLTGISYALFLVLAVSIRFSGSRLYLLAPGITLGALFVALRTLYLRTGGSWQYAWSFAIALVCGQISVGLFYLPLQPIQFGLLLVGVLYAAVNLADRSIHHILQKTDLIEPGIALIVAILLAFLMQ